MPSDYQLLIIDKNTLGRHWQQMVSWWPHNVDNCLAIKRDYIHNFDPVVAKNMIKSDKIIIIKNKKAHWKLMSTQKLMIFFFSFIYTVELRITPVSLSR